LDFYVGQNVTFSITIANNLLQKLTDTAQIAANFSMNDTTSSQDLFDNLVNHLK
jgi:hypothetical protein